MMTSLPVLLLSVFCVSQATEDVVSALFSKKHPCTIPTSFSSLEVSSLITCSNACLASQDCEAFSYSKQNGECLLHDTPFSDDGCHKTSKHFTKQSNSCLNNGFYDTTIKMCHCFDGYVGQRCERLMQDCSEGVKYPYYEGRTEVMKIKPLLSPHPFFVVCEMRFDGRTYIQSRYNTEPMDFFDRHWLEYKLGFGEVANCGDFWIGNEKIHYITKFERYKLRIKIWHGSDTMVTYLFDFKIGNEAENFKLSFNFIQNSTDPLKYLGDCMGPLRNAAFSTPDRDNDGNSTLNCGFLRKSGWWFKGPDCAVCNPNGYMTSNEFRTGNEEDAFWTPTLGNKAIHKVVMSLAKIMDK